MIKNFDNAYLLRIGHCNEDEIVELVNLRATLVILKDRIKKIVTKSRFLVIGGAGTIGNAVVKEIFSRSPIVLDVIDLSENNLVEVVRDLRSSIGFEFPMFKTLCGANEVDGEGFCLSKLISIVAGLKQHLMILTKLNLT